MTIGMKVLQGQSLKIACADLKPHWHYPENPGTQSPALTAAFVFEDFRQAFAFMTQVAMLAEKVDHHPDWSNVYNRVSIALTTHDAGAITLKDIELARQIDAVLAHSPGVRSAAQ
jgi:4a-hydroxytetrahydrobiopterin dehydratase